MSGWKRTAHPKPQVMRVVVGKVTSKDNLGRPRTLELLYDEESTYLEGGEEFVTLQVVAEAFAPKLRGKA